MQHLVIGTAGHVDHGKTALIRALTGQETDRLPEERARGISIDIGFAHFTLPSGRRAAIIDVPGHERFIRNMLAGITGIDLVLLVVAADEGVMPQTREHVDILRLLGIENGAVAITKIDLVDAELLELVEEDVREAVHGTFLERAPMLPVSAVTGAGLDQLVGTLDELLAITRAKDVTAFTRLPIDRAFVRPGFGTVVTGTLVGGTIRTGDRVNLLPGDEEVRVRGLQIHGSKVDAAEAGQRVAANLSGVDRGDVRRGHVLAAPGMLRTTVSFAGKLSILESWAKAVAHGTRVHLHTGTSEVVGRILILDRDELESGQSGYILFKSEEPLVVGRGDRFIVRSYSPVHTMGGGAVIEPHAQYRRNNPRDLQELKAKETGGRAGVVAEILARSGPTALSVAELARRTEAPPDALRPDLEALAQTGEILALEGGFYIHRRGYTDFIQAIHTYLERFFKHYPLRSGAPKEELRRKALAGTDARAFAATLARAGIDGRVIADRDRLMMPGRMITLTPEQDKAIGRIIRYMAAAEFSPPSLGELRAEFPDADVDELVIYLQEQGEVVRLADDLMIHARHLAEARQRTRAFLGVHGKMTVAEFRDFMGTTRKYALPLLDYFDAERWTRRVGDERVPGPAL